MDRSVEEEVFWGDSNWSHDTRTIDLKRANAYLQRLAWETNTSIDNGNLERSANRIEDETDRKKAMHDAWLR